MTQAIISIGAKGTRREILSPMVYAKKVMHACPPHVARMIPCMGLTRVYALSSTYAVTLVTQVAVGLGSGLG